MNHRLAGSKGEGPAQKLDPALVRAAVRKIQKHYLDQSFTRRPARLPAIIAVAALVRLAEKKSGDDAFLAGRQDGARRFLKAALEQFETTEPRRS